MHTHTAPRPLAHRLAWVLAAAALVLMLALAACGGRNAQNGTYGNPTTSGTSSSTGGSGGTSGSGSTSSGAGATAQQAQSADQQIQAALQAMDSAQSAANVDYSSQDNPVQP